MQRGGEGAGTHPVKTCALLPGIGGTEAVEATRKCPLQRSLTIFSKRALRMSGGQTKLDGQVLIQTQAKQSSKLPGW